MTSDITYAGTLEYEDIERTLKAIADENPEYVYISPYRVDDINEGSCVYSTIVKAKDDGTWDGNSFGQNTIVPSCIVGHLIYRLFGEFALRQVNWHCNMGGWQNAFGALRIQIVGSKAAHLLNAAQSLQDSRLPWGRAVTEAIRIANDYALLDREDTQVMEAISDVKIAYASEQAGKEPENATVGESATDNPGAVSDL